MLPNSLLVFFLAPVCLGIGFRERYATFHTSISRLSACRIPLTIGDDCSDPVDPNYENFNMDTNACINQQGRHSFMPGKKATTAAVYCFVFYEEDNCNCIKGARKIHPTWKEEPECESKEVAGYKSYHFEPAQDVSRPWHEPVDRTLIPEGECPVRGCYGLDPDGGNYPVEWEYVEEDSQGFEE